MNLYSYCLTTLASFFAILAPCSSQDLLVRTSTYGAEEGLPHREVNALFQDKRGFIWAGTKAGLSRFDGYEFQNHNSSSDGFLLNDIWRILEDGDGNLWLLPRYVNTDFDIWNPLTGKRASFSSRYGKLPKLPIIHSSYFQANTADGSILVPAADGSALLSFHPRKGFSSLKLEGVRYLKLVKAGAVTWGIADGRSLVSIDRKGSLRRFAIPDQMPLLRNVDLENVHARFILSGKDHCWLVDTTGQARLLGGKYYNPVLIPGASSPSIGEDLIFDNFRIYRMDGTLVYDLIPDRITSEPIFPRSILFDRAGNLWISTDFGITRITILRNYFENYLSRTDFSQNKVSSVRGMSKVGNKLLVAQEAKGPFWVDLDNGKSRRISLPVNNKGFNGVALLRDGGMAIGSINGVSFIDSQGDFLFHQNIPSRVVLSIYEHSPGELWLGTDKGLLEFNLKSRKLSAPSPPIHFADEENTWIYQIMRLKNGRIALSTSQGFYIVEKSSGAVQRYAEGETGRFYLPRSAILHIYEDPDGSIWLGTDGGGLIHLQIDQQALSRPDAGSGGPATPLHYRQYCRTTGFPDDVIYAVYPDQRGNLWLSSDNGIICFNKKTGGARSFLEEAGIPHREFNRISHFQDETGRLYFGGLNGIASFHPDSLLALDAQARAPTVVTSIFKFSGKTGQLEEITSEYLTKGSITLQPGDRNLTVDVALLNFRNVKATGYAWKIDGLDEDWSFSRLRSQRFDRLSYGDYHLMVKAMDTDGNWSKSVIDIPIRVRPPFYRTIWFYALLVLVTATGMGYYVRWRTRRLKSQNDFLQQEVARRTRTIAEQAAELRSLEQLKSRFFANVSHELRTPLSLMIGPVETMRRRLEGQEENQQLLGFVHRNARHLLRLVNEILDLSKLESGKLEVKEQAVHFYAFLRPLVSQYSSYSDSERVRWHFEYRAGRDLVLWLDIPKFEKIIHNFLSNAVKYTPPGKQIMLEVEEQEAHVLICVKDEGPGIHPEDVPHVFDRFYQSSRPEALPAGGTGIGLSMSYELAHLLGGSVWVESVYGQGSAFFFRFPKNVAPVEQALPEDFQVEAWEMVAEKTPARRGVAAEAAGGAGETILVVEDNADLRAYIALLLGMKYRVREAVNGQEAWEQLQGEDLPDLVISDLMMPVMDGLELLERVKGSDRLCNLPVIMLTARADVQVRLRALRIGVDDYLSKPFVEEELLVRVARLLDNYRQRRELPELPAGDLEVSGGDVSPVGVIGVHDMKWLAEVEAIYIEGMADGDLVAAVVAARLNLSERQFFRRLKQLTGLTPNLYLREIRLQTARDYLQQQRFATVKETCAAVGFTKTKYFSGLFQERFGAPPFHYLP
ncbi:MAG: hypothetical protein RI973_1847 [Bacteroidota bacterium]